MSIGTFYSFLLTFKLWLKITNRARLKYFLRNNIVCLEMLIIFLLDFVNPYTFYWLTQVFFWEY